MPKSTRCAACKALRRGCATNCIFAPYFPANNPERYYSVHKIFGANNVAKSLQDLPVHKRADAANCMSFEARWRKIDPVYGCTGLISRMQDQIVKAQFELAQVQAQSALYWSQIQPNQAQSALYWSQIQPNQAQMIPPQSSWVNNVDGIDDQFVNEEGL